MRATRLNLVRYFVFAIVLCDLSAWRAFSARTAVRDLLATQYDYDPYGRLIRETGPKAASCPFRYSTKYRDPDLELYYYGHRWYDAAAMKWLTPDPIGERGGANLTAFCDGDPINHVDPLGLEGQPAVGFTIPYRSPMGRFLLPAHSAMLGEWSREERQMLLDYAEETGPAKRDAAVALNVVALSCMVAPALPFIGGSSASAIPVAAPAAASTSGGSATPLIFHWFHQSRWLGPIVRVGTAVGTGMGLQAIKAPVSTPPMRQATNFYVTPDGVAVPATGYRYFSGEKNLRDAMSGVLPRRSEGMYVSFSEYATDLDAGRALQIPYKPRYRISFDTLNHIAAMRVPYARLDTGTQLEPYTFSYREFGAGGATQVKVFDDIFVMPESLVPLIRVNAPLMRPLVQEIPSSGP